MRPLLLLALVLAAAGCGGLRTAVPVDDPAAPALGRMNARLAERWARVLFRDGTAVVGRGVAVGVDSTRWTDRTGERRSAPTAGITAVEAAVFEEPAAGRTGSVVGFIAGLFGALGAAALTGDHEVSAGQLALGVGIGVAAGAAGWLLDPGRGRGGTREGRFVLVPPAAAP